MIKKCVDCNLVINDGHLCDSCFRIRMEEKNEEDRIVESPHASWF